MGKAKAGAKRRPPEEKASIHDAIIDAMESGLAQSLTTACEIAGMKKSTFLLDCTKDVQLADRYARAHDEMIDRMAEKALEIADEPVGSTDNGSTDSGAVQKQRLQVDTRKWLLAKLHPSKYGDRIQNDVNLTQKLDDSDLDARIAAILKSGG